MKPKTVRYDKASVAGAENSSPCVIVGNGGGNRVKGCLGEVLVRTISSRRNKDPER